MYKKPAAIRTEQHSAMNKFRWIIVIAFLVAILVAMIFLVDHYREKKLAQHLESWSAMLMQPIEWLSHQKSLKSSEQNAASKKNDGSAANKISAHKKAATAHASQEGNVDSAIHFEFYTALPNMQIDESIAAASSKENAT